MWCYSVCGGGASIQAGFVKVMHARVHHTNLSEHQVGWWLALNVLPSNQPVICSAAVVWLIHLDGACRCALVRWCNGALVHAAVRA